MRNTRSDGSLRMVAWSCLAILIALNVVGAVSIRPGSLRHQVQTLPLWVPIVTGFQGREVAKWAALPCQLFWLLIMVVIWLFLLGWAQIVSGHFTATEIVLTLIVGTASIGGLVAAVRTRTTVRPISAIGWVVTLAVLQIGAMWLSLFPYIAGR